MAFDRDTILNHFRTKAADRMTERLFERFGNAPSGVCRDIVERMFFNLFNGEAALTDEFMDEISEEMVNDGFELDDDDRAFVTHFAEGMTAYSEIVWEAGHSVFGQMG